MAALLVVTGGSAGAAPAPVGPPQVRCTPDDPRLTELSGMVVVDGEVLAVGDGGAAPQVVHLDAGCAATGTTTADVDPYDVEDLATGPGGTLWLSDTGDNRRARDTVALLVLDSAGVGEAGVVLHRLTYPDGPHDAEALLVGRDGVPVVVTKEIGGAAGVYAPAGPLATPGPTPLARVGSVSLGPTSTPGGPLGSFGSVLVTGGAVSPDGTVLALRTYTDAWVYDAPDGDLVAALARTPLQVPLPDEPQGEAVALTADGALLSAGEQAGDAAAPPVREVPGVVAALRTGAGPGGPGTGPAPPPPSPALPAASPEQPPTGVSSRALVGVGAVVVLGAAALALAVRRSRR